MTDKQVLRRQLRALRRDIPSDYRHLAATRAAHLAETLPDWERARQVALYLATAEEFDCGPLQDAAWRNGKQTCLPAMGAGTLLHFRRYSAGDALHADRYGIRQPAETAEAVMVGSLDIMFLPLVGWSAQGTRLGMGAGYYDRALAAARPHALVGLGYDCQECDTLPSDPWDVSLDYVLTESRLVLCGSD